MFVDIAQIPAEGLDVQFRGTEDFLDPSGEWVRLLRPVEAALHFCRNPTVVLVREHVLLTLPVQALCHDECRGLCPQCGINLNRETCPCSSTAIDPRWRSLEPLR